MTNRIDPVIARAAGIVRGMHLTLSNEQDWNAVDREGVLRCLIDLQRILLADRPAPVASVTRTHIEAQEIR